MDTDRFGAWGVNDDDRSTAISTSQNTSASSSAVAIPVVLWKRANQEMVDKQQRAVVTNKKNNNNKSNKGPRGTSTTTTPSSSPLWLRHFTFVLKDEEFKACRATNSVSNLFFEHARITGENVSKDYIVVQMADDEEEGQQLLDDEQGPKKQHNKKKKNRDSDGKRANFSYDSDPLREMILRNGIRGFRNEQEEEDLNEGSLLYSFIGCSNSQVQRHCYIFRRAQTVQENELHLSKILPNLSALEQKKGAPKRVKYSGLLFSGVKCVDLPNDEDIVVVKEIASKKNHGYDFTDGPGLISLKLAQYLQRQLGIPGPNPPSVFQIRYCGRVARIADCGDNNNKGSNGGQGGYVCKGVLLVDPSNEETFEIALRESMLKVECSDVACRALQHTLGICAFSRPAGTGRLGQQLVCLLSGIVDKKDFFHLQKEHLDGIQNHAHDPLAMAWMLAMNRKRNMWSNFHKLVLDKARKCPDNVPRLYQTCTAAARSGPCVPSSEKVQISVGASRTLFGAVFPELLHDVLEEGECVVLLEQGPLLQNHKTLVDGHNKGAADETFVIVSRSPSYHPGDIRVLRVLSLPDDHPVCRLRNCILFSTKGDRPESDKMGGGDLDGDMYLVMWHPTLLKYADDLRSIKPALYDLPPQQDMASESASGTMVKSDWIHYAAWTDNIMLTEVENTFYRTAKKFGVQSPEIERLNALFSSLVDRNPTSLDEFKKLKSLTTGPPSFASGECIWEELGALQASAVKEINSSPGLQSYQKFLQEMARYASPTTLRELFLEEHGHHFFASPWYKDVVSTVGAWQRICADDNAGSQSSSRLVVGVKKGAAGGVVDDPAPAGREVTTKERRKLGSYEERAYKLFAKDFASLQQQISETDGHVNEQTTRLEVQSRKKDADAGALLEKIVALQDLQTQEVIALQSQLQILRGHWDREKMAQRDRFAPRIHYLKKAKESNKRLLVEKEAELAAAKVVVASMWYYSEFLSSAKRQATENVRRLECDINGLTQTLRSLRDEIANHEKDLRLRLRCMGDREEAAKNAAKRKTNCLLKQREKEVKNHIVELASCIKRYDDLVDGTEKRRLVDLADRKEMELASLCQERAGGKLTAVEEDAATNELRTELRALRRKIEATFCPVTLRQLKAKRDDLEDLNESLMLGRGHILRKVKQAGLKWTEAVKSSPMSRSERQQNWNKVLKNLDRIYTIEENRLLGFPRNGERDERLPVYKKRGLLRRLMCSAQAVVITAGTGCGKSTQLPQYIADDFCLYRGSDDDYPSDDIPVRICCTQPRRVAAQNIASRVAGEYETEVGDLVGFRVGVRGHSREESVQTSANTVIEFVTEGLLLHNLAKSAEFIKRYDCVIIDEMHERNAQQDLCLSLLRDYLAEYKSSRPSFRVVVMSASIDADRFCEYLHNCPTMDCPGKVFPVQEEHIPPDTEDGVVEHAVDVLFSRIVEPNVGDGDVLIFFSGAKEIEQGVSLIRERADDSKALVAAYPLYSKLDYGLQQAAANPDHRSGPYGEIGGKFRQKVRKVICSTNIAETSLTIRGVSFVIDSGLAKKSAYNHSVRCSVLAEARISRASAIQRKGRAGRTSSGQCYYLYSNEVHTQTMKEYDTPKILEESVDELILFSLGVCGRSIEEMGLLDAPDGIDVSAARERLLDLKFVELNDSQSTGGGGLHLTESGQLACTLSSLRPEAVQMILRSREICPRYMPSIIKLAVLVSADDATLDTKASAKNDDQNGATCHAYGDHLLALQQWEEFEAGLKNGTKRGTKLLKQKCKDRGLDFRTLKNLQEDASRIHQELKRRKLVMPIPQDASGISLSRSHEECLPLLRCLISGFFHQVVECLDIEFLGKANCCLLSQRSLVFRLDRDSCLHGVVAREEDFIQDDYVYDRHHDGDSDNCFGHEVIPRADAGDSAAQQVQLITEEAVATPSFLVFGGLKSPGGYKGFLMSSASMVEGAWILEEAPDRWKDRVKFDPKKQSYCRISIKHVGPSILKQCSRDFFKNVETNSNGVIVDPAGCQIRISGTQAAVESAKDAIQRKLASVINRHRQSDRCFNRSLGLRFSEGMTVVDSTQWKGDRRQQLHELLCARGTNGKHFCFLIDHQKSVVHAFPVQGCSLGLLRRCLEGVKDFKFTLEQDRYACQLKFKACDVKARQKGTPNSSLSNWFEAARMAVSILKQHDNFSVVRVALDSFHNKNARSVARALIREATRNGPFWAAFQTGLLGEGAKKRTNCIRVARSGESFVFFGLGCGDVADNFKQRVVKCADSRRVHEVKLAASLPYQVRRFVAILGELKKDHPGVLFHVLEVVTDKDGVIENVELLSDYEWLVKNRKDRRIESIQLSLVASQNVKLRKAHDCVRKMLCPDSLGPITLGGDTKESGESKVCVMCRRPVLVRFGERCSQPTEEETKVLHGWNLQLCGCAYCRECFLNGATESLADPLVRSAQCRNCSTVVLAKDCDNILLVKDIDQAKHPFHKQEWDQFCRLAEANYCQDNVLSLTTGAHAKVGAYKGRHYRKRGWLTCIDCGVSMVYPAGYLFVICRNVRCGRKICTRCAQVVTSEEELERCASSECPLPSDDE